MRRTVSDPCYDRLNRFTRAPASSRDRSLTPLVRRTAPRQQMAFGADGACEAACLAPSHGFLASNIAYDCTDYTSCIAGEPANDWDEENDPCPSLSFGSSISSDSDSLDEVPIHKRTGEQAVNMGILLKQLHQQESQSSTYSAARLETEGIAQTSRIGTMRLPASGTSHLAMPEENDQAEPGTRRQSGRLAAIHESSREGVPVFDVKDWLLAQDLGIVSDAQHS